MKITQKQLDIDCAVIAHLTDINHHTRALIRLAEMVGHDKYPKILFHIDKIHELEGHLTAPLCEMRREISIELRKIAERDFTLFEYSQIMEAL